MKASKVIIASAIVAALATLAARVLTRHADERLRLAEVGGTDATPMPTDNRGDVRAVLTKTYRSPGEERSALTLAIERSGRSSAPWTVDAKKVLEQRRLASQGPDITFRMLECYDAACFAEAHILSNRGTTSPPDEQGLPVIGWSGPSITTTEERTPSGESVALWILLRPDDIVSSGGL